MRDTIRNIKSALLCFGYDGPFRLSFYGDRVLVLIDGERYGVWDTEKKTFVD